MVCAFYLQAAMWLPVSPVGVQALGFAPYNPLEHTYDRHMCPADGFWPIPGVHCVAAPCTALSRGSFMILSELYSSHSINIVGHADLWA